MWALSCVRDLFWFSFHGSRLLFVFFTEKFCLVRLTNETLCHTCLGVDKLAYCWDPGGRA